MFKRRKGQGEDVEDLEVDVEAVDEDTEADDNDSPVEYDRAAGPWDISEVDEPDAMAAERIDFGAIQVPLIPGMEVRVEIDPESNEPAAITLVHGEGAVQVRAFAAPRSGGGWQITLDELRAQISGDGGTVEESVGPFGGEVAAAVQGEDENGQTVVQPVRFVGVDGPRWSLQGVMFGAGADPAAAGDLEDVFRSLVVMRGDTAMPSGMPLPLSLPEQVPGDVEQSGPADQ
ncbi:MAG: DUF3710 domain-containing protein [Candidatus Nanopelagicales bacterium]